ncbi:MAG: DUF4982 domain-containing protein [Lachnospiraceae bacterium]|nr:DUF4982 domain-containing protein [Lachnospiraceae bacterium]
MDIRLEKNVKFIRRDVEDGYDIHLDDSAWETVLLPHDWSAALPFEKSASSGTGYLPGGTGWYRIPFEVSEEQADCEFTICFQGVYKHARVWCNNTYLGSWASGYTSFSFDCTHAIKPGRRNLISVRVSHEDLSDSRWYNGSGITRPVVLKVRDRNHFADDSVVWEYGEDGFLQVRALLACPAEGKNVTLLWDGKAYPAAVYAECEESRVSFRISVKGERLWSPEDPFLHDLELVLGVQGRETDRVRMRVGLRSFRFTPDQGFFCNGISYKLKGVCLHEDAGSFGTAVPENVWRRRLWLLKEMGANTIRMSHNPHAECLYELCDELGFFVIDEVFDEWEGSKNKWWQGHNVYPPRHQGYFLDYPAWHAKDVEAFVKARRNHTCVILWSIGNEIDYPNDPYCHPSFTQMTGNNDAGKPEAERRYDPMRPNAERLVPLARELSDLVRRFDRTRGVTLASAFPELSADLGLFGPLDVIGYNYKEQFYEQDHKRFPDQPIFGSENGHSRAAWLAVTEHDYIAGQCLWTGIDYLGETRGWPEHGSRAGHLTTAGDPKADFYFRKSLWTKEPMVKLATWIPGDADWMEYRTFAWDYEAGQRVRVEAYTNCARAELFLNGTSLGAGERDDEGRFFWDTDYAPGELRVEAYAPDAEAPAAQDALYTAGEPVNLRITLLDAGIPADGLSCGQILAELLDAEGRRVTAREEHLKVSVSGCASLLHMDNGNLADTTAYMLPERDTFHGMLMIYVRAGEAAGDAELRIARDGRPEAHFTFRVG